MFDYWDVESSENLHLRRLLQSKVQDLYDSELHGDAEKRASFVQFVLDPSVAPEVIIGVQGGHFKLSEIFRLTRTYCYAMHRSRMQLLGKFKVL